MKLAHCLGAHTILCVTSSLANKLSNIAVCTVHCGSKVEGLGSSRFVSANSCNDGVLPRFSRLSISTFSSLEMIVGGSVQNVLYNTIQYPWV